ncbi:PAS domain S-box-containing protein [Methylobacterium phyllostachyos]|uniref:histidine kinase n=1 Tax=Methylobacterium phyllostachyos TaxID=582672 RepID=A0A1G9TD11_9HYPH|nr:histidine kinase dimerization/phosphoacceptor domain -containing protein [Methylobacterium phyllostachyos]SDM45540.1 PAS domain S-box-containing protein [Methylobacterium phyllostachyos]
MLVDAFARSPSPMVITDARAPDNPVAWANAAFLQSTGYGVDEVVGRNCRMLQGPATDRATVERIRTAIQAAEPISVELLNYRKDGTAFWNAMTITPVSDADGVAFYYAAQADMTHVHQFEVTLRGTNDELERLVDARTQALTAALEQKTALLHEVDHRVKNNLQVISSLMLLKARRTPEGEARDALQSMAERIGALSTAHRLLYSEGDCAHFNLGEFASEFLADMNAGLDPERRRVEADVEPIAVAAAMAAPLALLIHELTANALRHAFPDEREGRVSIAARRNASGMHLTIRDDGVGLAGASPNPAGFGRNLVEMVVRQMRGTIVWTDAAPGTNVEIDIPLQTAS